MECLKICLAGLVLLVVPHGSHAAPPHVHVLRPQDKRSVANPDAGLQRLAGLNGFGGLPSYFGYDQSAAYYPGDVLATAGFDGFGVPSPPHYDLGAGFAAFQYPAATFGFDVHPGAGYPFPALQQPETPGHGSPPVQYVPNAAALPADNGATNGQSVPSGGPTVSQQQQPRQQQPEPVTTASPSDPAVAAPGPEPVPDLVLELRPPAYSAPPSEYANHPTIIGDNGESRPTQAAPVPGNSVDFESVPSVSYSLPAGDPSSAVGPGDAPSRPSSPPADQAPPRNNVVIVVSNNLYGGESDAGLGPTTGPLPVSSGPNHGQPQQQQQVTHSNPLSSKSYGDSNSIQSPFRIADNGVGFYPKIVIPGTVASGDSNAISANSKREQPAVVYFNSSPEDKAPPPSYYPSNVTPRD